MLSALRIKNLALVSDLTVEFQQGLNVITGETGAGKSILIGALNLVLGERADRTLLRSGTESCTVEAVFQFEHLPARIGPFLEENGLEPCDHHQLLLKRSFAASGANRQFINGSPATLQVLASLGQWLVDLHGPHDHQSLLQPATQLGFIDAFGGLEPARAPLAALLQQHRQLQAAKAELVIDEQSYAQQLDLLEFQSREIEAARLQPDEEEDLQQRHQRVQNAATLLQLGQTSLGLLADEENSLLSQAGILGRTLQELHRTDPAAPNLLQLQEHAVHILQELQQSLSRYLDRLEVDPEQLQALEDRLNLIQSLKRKYGRSLPDIIHFGQEAHRKLLSLQQRESELARLNRELNQTRTDFRRQAQALSAQRRKVLPKLARAVSRHLADLGFQQSHFHIDLQSQNEPAPDLDHQPGSGLDSAEFQFAPNPGEPARPLRAIASSGEMARVMLALKTALAAEDQIPVLVFDEVDANVGGATARAVGEKMRRIACHHQVFCVTHLAPVAAFAQAHFQVTKSVSQGRTVSEISLLRPEERVAELGRMLGGNSEAARRLAESILQDA